MSYCCQDTRTGSGGRGGEREPTPTVLAWSGSFSSSQQGWQMGLPSPTPCVSVLTVTEAAIPGAGMQRKWSAPTIWPPSYSCKGLGNWARPTREGALFPALAPAPSAIGSATVKMLTWGQGEGSLVHLLVPALPPPLHPQDPSRGSTCGAGGLPSPGLPDWIGRRQEFFCILSVTALQSHMGCRRNHPKFEPSPGIWTQVS